MALDKSHKWLTNSKDELEKKILHFKKETGLVPRSVYEKRHFCSGFAAENVVLEADGAIYAISDSFTIYKRKDTGWEKI